MNYMYIIISINLLNKRNPHSEKEISIVHSEPYRVIVCDIDMIEGSDASCQC